MVDLPLQNCWDTSVTFIDSVTHEEAWGSVVCTSQQPCPLKSTQMEIGIDSWSSFSHFEKFRLFPHALEKPLHEFSYLKSYLQPHQVSKVSSFWPMERGRWGKSAKQFRNFGKRNGSEDWAQKASSIYFSWANTARDFGFWWSSALVRVSGKVCVVLFCVLDDHLRTGTVKRNPTV